jgi:hypothetical protein
MFLLNHKNRSTGILIALMSAAGSAALSFQAAQTHAPTILATVVSTAISTPVTTTLVTTLVPRTQFITIDPITLPDETVAAKTITLDIPECSPTIIPDSNGYVPPGNCNAQYNYYPSFAAALVASIFFGVVTFVHIAEGIKYKKVSLPNNCWNLN